MHESIESWDLTVRQWFVQNNLKILASADKDINNRFLQDIFYPQVFIFLLCKIPQHWVSVDLRNVN